MTAIPKCHITSCASPATHETTNLRIPLCGDHASSDDTPLPAPTFSYRTASPEALGARWDVLTEEVSIWKVEYALPKMLAEALAEADAEAQQRITALEAANKRLVDWLGRTQVERDDAERGKRVAQENAVLAGEEIQRLTAQLAALTAEARLAEALDKRKGAERNCGLVKPNELLVRFRSEADSREAMRLLSAMWDAKHAPTPAGVTIKRDGETVATVLWHDNQYRVESVTKSWVASTPSCASAIYAVNNLMRPNQPFVQDDEMRALLALAATGGAE